MVDQGHAELGFETADLADEGVDRATGGAGRRLVHGDDQEARFAQFTGRAEGMAVRRPHTEERVDGSQHSLGLGWRQRALGCEDPEAGVVRQGSEGHQGMAA